MSAVTDVSCDAVQMRKTPIRRAALAARDALPVRLRAEKSARIAAMTLNHLDGRLVRTVHDDGKTAESPLVAAFWPFGSEVDTRPLIAGIVARGWRLALPCMVRPPQSRPSCRTPAVMRFLQVDARRLDEAVSRFAAEPISPHGPDEPWMAAFPTADIPDIDAFVVPLVAFDDDGNRLGYGGGNYDRALPFASSDAVIIGIAFAEQRVPTVPALPHDIRIPIISA